MSISEQNDKTVAVIGAGLAGLVAACKLAQSGAAVTVYEKDAHGGGRARTARKEGFDINLGPHALYKAGELYGFLSQNGLAPVGAVPSPSRPVALYRGTVDELPIVPRALLFNRYLGLGGRLELVSVLNGLGTADAQALMSTPLASWLAKTIRRPVVRQTMESLARVSTYCNNPEQMSAGAAILQLRRALKGVLYLDHGWQSIIDSLQQKAVSLGVSFVYGAHITEVAGTAGGAELSGEGIRQIYNAAILCVPPESLKQLVPAAAAAAALSAETLVASQVACLDVCLSRLPVKLNTFALGIDEPLYFSVHSATAKLTPNGGAIIHVSRYMKDGESWEGTEERLERILDQLQPGWRNLILYKRYLPHMVASYGTALASLGGASGLDGPQIPGVENVYASGDYVGRGAMLADCSAASALAAAHLVLAKKQAALAR